MASMFPCCIVQEDTAKKGIGHTGNTLHYDTRIRDLILKECYVTNS